MSSRSNRRARRRYRQAIHAAARAGLWTHDGFLGDLQNDRNLPEESSSAPDLDPRAVAVAQHVSSEIARLNRLIHTGARGNPWKRGAWERGATRTSNPGREGFSPRAGIACADLHPRKG